MPHGGVLQNQWMKVLERLCSGTSGWPRIRCSMQPLPSLPCPLSGLSLSSSAETSRLLSIWDTAVHPTHQRLTYIGCYQVVVVAIFDELLRARLNLAKNAGSSFAWYILLCIYDEAFKTVQLCLRLHRAWCALRRHVCEITEWSN